MWAGGRRRRSECSGVPEGLDCSSLSICGFGINQEEVLRLAELEGPTAEGLSQPSGWSERCSHASWPPLRPHRLPWAPLVDRALREKPRLWTDEMGLSALRQATASHAADPAGNVPAPPVCREDPSSLGRGWPCKPVAPGRLACVPCSSYLRTPEEVAGSLRDCLWDTPLPSGSCRVRGATHRETTCQPLRLCF